MTHIGTLTRLIALAFSVSGVNNASTPSPLPSPLLDAHDLAIIRMEQMILQYEKIEGLRIPVILTSFFGAIEDPLTPEAIDHAEHHLLTEVRQQSTRLARVPDSIEWFLLAHDQE